MKKTNHMSSETICSICLDELNSDYIVTPFKCMHSFHKKCLDLWFKTSYSCPYCRSQETIQSGGFEKKTAKQSLRFKKAYSTKSKHTKKQKRKTKKQKKRTAKQPQTKKINIGEK